MNAETFYRGEAGRAYYRQRGSLRSEIEQRKRSELFAGLTSSEDIVLDFGCGNGGVLSHLPAAYRLGVEISEQAADEARRRLDRVVSSLEELDTSSVDVIVSYHALEHVVAPFDVLRQCKRVLKAGGRIRLVVPSETGLLKKKDQTWVRSDKDNHLYTWTPLTLGNLMTVAGFDVTDGQMVPGSSGSRYSSVWSCLWY